MRPVPRPRGGVPARRGEGAEVRFEDFLVRRRRVGVAGILPRHERALINLSAGVGIDQREIRRGRNVHLTEAAQVITDAGFLRKRWHVTFLIHVNRGAVAQGVGRVGELRGHRPERAVRIFDFDDLIGRDRTGQLQIEAVVDAQVAHDQRRIERAAPEGHRCHRHRLAVDRHGEFRQRGRV